MSAVKTKLKPTPCRECRKHEKAAEKASIDMLYWIGKTRRAEDRADRFDQWLRDRRDDRRSTRKHGSTGSTKPHNGAARQLVWFKDDDYPDVWRARLFREDIPAHEALFDSQYSVFPIGGGRYAGDSQHGMAVYAIPRRYFRGVKTLDAAKAACQRHFDDVVRSLMAVVK